MIIPSSKEGLGNVPTVCIQVIFRFVTSDNPNELSQDDPPPTYVPSSDFPPVRPPEIVKPPSQACNFISFVRKNNSVKGSFVVDPSLLIPSALLPPLPEGEAEESRKNLRLESTNGSVDTDIMLVGEDVSENVKTNPRTTLHLKSENGRVVARVVHIFTFL